MAVLTGYSYDLITTLEDEDKSHFKIEKIDQAFDIKSTDDKADIHPKKYCNKCYTSLLNF